MLLFKFRSVRSFGIKFNSRRLLSFQNYNFSVICCISALIFIRWPYGPKISYYCNVKSPLANYTCKFFLFYKFQKLKFCTASTGAF